MRSNLDSSLVIILCKERHWDATRLNNYTNKINNIVIAAMLFQSIGLGLIFYIQGVVFAGL